MHPTHTVISIYIVCGISHTHTHTHTTPHHTMHTGLTTRTRTGDQSAGVATRRDEVPA